MFDWYFIVYLYMCVKHFGMATIKKIYVFYALLSTTYIRASTSDIATLPINRSNIIFQEVDYFENSAISSSYRGQALYFFQVAT